MVFYLISGLPRRSCLTARNDVLCLQVSVIANGVKQSRKYDKTILN